MTCYTINLPPVSKKNSQRIITNRKTGRIMILPSKKYKEYEEAAGAFISRPEKPIDFACNVKCIFYMPTRRKCDLTNLLEAIDDVLVKYGILEDDNYTIIAGHDGSRVCYDKENPRTEIEISETNEAERFIR